MSPVASVQSVEYQNATVHSVSATTRSWPGTPTSATTPADTSTPRNGHAESICRRTGPKTVAAKSTVQASGPTAPTTPNSATIWRYQFWALSNARPGAKNGNIVWNDPMPTPNQGNSRIIAVAAAPYPF